MDAASRRWVFEGVRDRCEYCQRHQQHQPLVPFHVEHIIARDTVERIVGQSRARLPAL